MIVILRGRRKFRSAISIQALLFSYYVDSESYQGCFTNIVHPPTSDVRVQSSTDWVLVAWSTQGLHNIAGGGQRFILNLVPEVQRKPRHNQSHEAAVLLEQKR